MAVSRRTLLFCCLGTLLVILLFLISTAEAVEDELSESYEIHAVKHTAALRGGGGCKGGVNSEKGNQCQDDDNDDDEDLDEDADDTYKIVNNVKVSLSSTGKLSRPHSLNDANYNSDVVDHYNHEGVVVLGH